MSFGNQTEKRDNRNSTRVRVLYEFQAAVALCVLSIGSLVAGQLLNSSLLCISSVIFIYATCLWLKDIFALAVIAAYSVTALIFPELSATIIRVELFSALLIVSTLSHYRIPPFAIFSVAWLTLLLASGLQFAPATQLLSDEVLPAPAIAVIEVCAVLTLGILSYSRSLSWALNRRKQIFAITGLFTHVPILACLLLCLTFGTVQAGLLHTPPIFDPATYLLSLNIKQSVVLLATLWIPLVAGIALSNINLHFVKYLVEVIQSRSLARFGADAYSVLAEFSEGLILLRNTLEASSQTMRIAEKTNKELSGQFNQKISEIKELQAKILAHRKMLDASPWGCISITADGIIREVNSHYSELLGLETRPSIGKHFRQNNTATVWGQEIHTFLSLACAKYKELLLQHHTIHHSSTIDGENLEVVACCTLLQELPVESAETNALPSEISITLFLKRTSDLREHTLQMLTPTPYDAAGYQAVEFCKEAHAQIAEALQSLTKLRTFVNNYQHVLNGVDDSEGEVQDFTRSSESLNQVLHKLFTTAGHINAGMRSLEGQQGQVNLSTLMAGSFQLLNELLCVDAPIALEKTSTLNTDLDGTVIGDVLKSQALPDILIKANQHDVLQWCAFFTSLVATLSTRSSGLKATIGYETIGSTTANLIPGSASGKFVRLVLSHPGQSLMSSVRTDNLIERVATSGRAIDPDTALAFLMIQTKRLEGFISAQSNPTKGTTITIYLPISARPGQREALLLNLKKQQSKDYSVSSRTQNKNVLIVSSSQSVSNPIKTTLDALGFQAKVQEPKGMLADLESPTDLQGLGFGDDTSSLEQDQADPALSVADSEHCAGDFDVLVVDVEIANSATMFMISELQKLHPNATTFLVMDADSEDKTMFSDWLTLDKPLESENLKQTFAKLLKS